MRRIVVAAEKGGTAKTTSTINLAAGLAARGRRVLVIDADPQANASAVLAGGETIPDELSLAAVLLQQVAVAQVIRPSVVPSVDVLPANANLAAANVLLADKIGRENRLRSALKPLNGYDVVIVDTAPSRSLLNVNALVAADEVLAPVEPSLFAMSGLVALQQAIAEVAEHLDNPRLRLLGVLLVRVAKNKVHAELELLLRQNFGALVFRTKIPAAVAVEESHCRRLPLVSYKPNSPVGLAYGALVQEVLSRESDANERDGRVGCGIVPAAEAA